MNKHGVWIAARDQLTSLCQFHETIRLKGGCWDAAGVFIYTTLNHIKYTLTNGDHGIISTLVNPLYVVKSHSDKLYAINREHKPVTLTIDPTEYLFKLALVGRHFDQVMSIIKNSSLVGQSIIAYLRQKGYPDVALQFVQDPVTRLDLALECGDIDVAHEMCK